MPALPPDHQPNLQFHFSTPDNDESPPHTTSLQRRLAAQQSKPKETPTPRPPALQIATYNIEDARQNRLELACRNLEVQQIDLAILTELRIPADKPIHTRHSHGYDIYATYTNHINQGGIALVTKSKTKNWSIESQTRHGPNVLSCILVSGPQRTPLIGVYLSPAHLDDIPFLVEALDRFPNSKPIVL